MRNLIAVIFALIALTFAGLPASAQSDKKASAAPTDKTCSACIATCNSRGGRTQFCPKYCQDHNRCP